VTWTIESVTIPVPSKCRIAKRANKEKMPVSGDFPAQSVDGAEMTVVLEGSFMGDMATVFTATVDPLLDLVGTQVTLSADGVLDGEWMLDDFTPNRDNPSLWAYTLTLSKGSTNYTFG
jgi:hypothetical protein